MPRIDFGVPSQPRGRTSSGLHWRRHVPGAGDGHDTKHDYLLLGRLVAAGFSDLRAFPVYLPVDSRRVGGSLGLKCKGRAAVGEEMRPLPAHRDIVY